MQRILLSLLTLVSLIATIGPRQAQAAPIASGILSPSQNAVVKGLVTIEGIAQHTAFRKWQLDLLIDGHDATFVAVGENMFSAPGILAQLDTTNYPDGEHLLRLRVVYTGLNYDEHYTPIIIQNGHASPGEPIETAEPVTTAAEVAPAETTTVAPDLRQESKAELAPPAKPEIIVIENGTLGAGVPDGHRWVQVDIGEQTLTAYQGETVVLKTKVSTGKPGWRTLPGTFNVYVKYPQTRMRGPGYDTPDVPWTMYYSGGFAIHGAYWHNNFGTPVSHGCVNLRVEEAKVLYHWAPEDLEVVVVQ